jgi:antitoxin (DNA-binding transcriptional repressor) of toxin-antitoxin stability system
VAAGEHIVVARGRPAVVLVPLGAEPHALPRAAPAGFASIAGALAAWPELNGAFDDVVAARARAKDRPAPDLD